MKRTREELIQLLKAAHTSLRAFSDTVPKDEQGWTTFDEDVRNAIEAALDAEETP